MIDESPQEDEAPQINVQSQKLALSPDDWNMLEQFVVNTIAREVPTVFHKGIERHQGQWMGHEALNVRVQEELARIVVIEKVLGLDRRPNGLPGHVAVNELQRLTALLEKQAREFDQLTADVREAHALNQIVIKAMSKKLTKMERRFKEHKTKSWENKFTKWIQNLMGV